MHTCMHACMTERDGADGPACPGCTCCYRRRFSLSHVCCVCGYQTLTLEGLSSCRCRCLIGVEIRHLRMHGRTCRAGAAVVLFGCAMPLKADLMIMFCPVMDTLTPRGGDGMGWLGWLFAAWRQRRNAPDCSAPTQHRAEHASLLHPFVPTGDFSS